MNPTVHNPHQIPVGQAGWCNPQWIDTSSPDYVLLSMRALLFPVPDRSRTVMVTRSPQGLHTVWLPDEFDDSYRVPAAMFGPSVTCAFVHDPTSDLNAALHHLILDVTNAVDPSWIPFGDDDQ